MSKAYPNIGGVLLAAGTSTRFGKENKLLHEVEGEPMVRLVATVLLEAGVGKLVVVLGHEAEAVGAALEGLEVEMVVNPNFEYGMGGSVAVGVGGLDEERFAGMLIALGDLLRLQVRDVRLVCEAFEAAGGERIAAPFLGRKMGHPVCFPRRLRKDLLALEGDRGARDLIRAEAETLVRVESVSEGSVRDLDTR